MKPIIAVVGRPNVGKSTFFNRVTRSRAALVENAPGVTRDRHYGDASWNGRAFTLVDTGGFEDADQNPFAGHIRTQIQLAVDHADAVIVMLDGKGGLSPYDRDLVEMLRDVDKPVLHVVNKIDGEVQEPALYEFYGLGIDPLYPISAEHGYGISDFLDALATLLPESGIDEAADPRIRVAVVGRPNAGKSSLINRIIGEERHVVSPVPGTTRDAIDSVCTVRGRQYLLVDTAGIRRKGKVREKIEKFSIIKALRSLDRCHVALIVLDAAAGITDQDISVAGYAEERGCGCIFLLNKWDLVEKDRDATKRYTAQIRDAAKFLGFAPVLTVSALTGKRVRKIFNLVDTVHDQYTTRIGTGPLNRIIENAVRRTPPALHQGKRLKFFYTTQVKANPPTIVCFVNYPDAVHFSYQRYLVNQIREETGLDRTPIRLLLRQKTGRMEFGSPKNRQGKKRRG